MPRVLIFGIVALIILLTGGYSIMETFWIEEKRIDIVHAAVPDEFNDRRIVLITDIHHGPFFSRQRLSRIVQRINDLEPDIIVLGGDYVHTSARYIEPCFAELKELKATLGVFGVLGNHDHRLGADLTRRSMERAGITLLDNRAYWLERGAGRIKIGGVGDYYSDEQDIAPTVGDADRDDFVILVSHNPDYAEELTTDKVDFVLAGHTHGGQVTFFGRWAPFIPSAYGQKYRTGMVKAPNTTVIVSNGIGTVTPPVRFFARPQIITVILTTGPPAEQGR